MPTLVIDPENCTGCKICELVCSMKFEGVYNPKRSIIKVLRNENLNVYIPVLKMGCLGENCSECVQGCPTNALEFMKTEEAAILRKRNKICRFPALRIRGDSHLE